MRTLAVALVASVLGTGCIIHDNDTTTGGGGTCLPSTITVGWNAFTFGDESTGGCAAAGVTEVDIYMDGTPVATWYCTDGGATITSVGAGTYLLTVEGIEASGRIAFRDEQTVTSSGCGDRYMFAEPAEGYVDLQYSFTPTNVCAADPSYLWFSVFDVAANAITAAVDSASALADKRLYECYYDDVLFPLPSGPYELDWMQEMVEGPGVGEFAVTGANCVRTGFDVPRGGTVGVPVVMVDATASCVP